MARSKGGGSGTKVHAMRPDNVLSVLRQAEIGDLELKHATGIDYQMLTAILDGKRQATAEQATRLARFLGDDPAWWQALYRRVGSSAS